MFCVIYRWQVKPDMQEQFRATWRAITEAIFAQHGSYGSRLHQNSDGGWIAYAQWPDRERWLKNEDTLGIDLARATQKDCLIGNVEVLFELEVTDDLLKDYQSQ